MILFKGKKYKFITTRDIDLDDIRAVFFPKDFREKYLYLGYIPFDDGTDYFKAIRPLILVMDVMAKPWWCPRWFLRLLHLFGSDNSIVRVRNRRLHDLKNRITSHILMFDHKTKWTDYDLRLSVSGPQEVADLADYIEGMFYHNGRKKDLLQRLEELGVSKDLYNKYDSIHKLEHLLDLPF